MSSAAGSPVPSLEDHASLRCEAVAIGLREDAQGMNKVLDVVVRRRNSHSTDIDEAEAARGLIVEYIRRLEISMLDMAVSLMKLRQYPT